ncbi:cobalamin-dependent protein [Candidatus Woesearchaeota archaeon]|nr:cobalamin-dependent protein [Candidatus Woesearchaeota archaeon]
MDILFISPPLSPKERYARDVGDTGGHLPPLGLASLAAYVREKNFSIGLIDSLALNYNEEDIIQYIAIHKPKSIGITSLTPIYHRAISLANKIKEKFPKILIILGGHHATIDYYNVVKDESCFDIVAIGEGEITAVEVLDFYKSLSYDYEAFLSSKFKLKEIDGIAFKLDKEIVVTNKRILIPDLDVLPYPARDLLPMDKYVPLPNQYKNLPIVHMVAIRGCPFACSFCSDNAIFGRQIRARSPKLVVEEIKHLKDKYEAKDISFWDDMMTSNKKWMEEFCDEMMNANLGITWTCYSRVDTVTKELLQKMYNAGCWNIFFGYESGDQELLNNINKGITLQQIEISNAWCKEIGIEIRASFMLALPGETPEKALKTIEFAKKLNPEYAQFCITTPYPGTKLFAEAHKYGTLSTDYSKYNIWEPVFVPFGYKNEEEIKAMEKRAMREFYLRPVCVFNHLKRIRSYEDFKRYVKGARFLLGFA